MSKYETKTRKVALSTNKYAERIRQIAQKQIMLINTSKKSLEVPVRVPMEGECVIVDAINFVTSISAYDETTSSNPDDYYNSIFMSSEIEQHEKDRLADELAFYISTELGDIFGSAFTDLKRNVKGLHGYKYQYTIGSDDYILGKVAFGGNKSTVLVMITGKGCYEASECFERNLYDFLNSCEKAKISRIDLALDDFNGDFSSAEQADLADTNNQFSLTNRQPTVQKLGDWKRHQGNGRTLQVGKRENGKMYRGYEKGKQLGDKESPWFRSEIELKNKDRVIPFDILINPTEYFAGSYPYCYELVEQKFSLENSKQSLPVQRIETMKNESEISFQKSVSVMKKQFGKYIKVFRELLPDHIKEKHKDTIILDLIETDKVVDYVPKRLKVTDSYFQRMLNPVNNQSEVIPFS